MESTQKDSSPCRHGEHNWCAACTNEKHSSLVPGLRAELDKANKEIDRLVGIEAAVLTEKEAAAVLDKLNGKGDVSLDYLRAREKLKKTAGEIDCDA